MQNKIIIGGIVIIVIAVGGFYVWKTLPTNTTPAAPVVAEDTRLTYASTTLGVSLKYPRDFTVDTAYAYTGFPKKPISGVKFTIPGATATGTNLSSDTGISVEQLPRAKKCTGDIYIVDNVKPVEMTVGSTTYSVATTSGAGAGNFYEEMVYAISGSQPCTALRYFIHSMNIGNFEQGVAREFDRAALLNAFDKIRQSLVLQ